MKCLCKFSIITHAYAMAYSSVITYIGVNQEKNIIQQKVESSGTIDTNTLKQEIEQEQELSRLHDTSGDINPYRELIVNNVEKVETILSQMEQWSILSNVINYVQYD